MMYILDFNINMPDKKRNLYFKECKQKFQSQHQIYFFIFISNNKKNTIKYKHIKCIATYQKEKQYLLSVTNDMFNLSEKGVGRSQSF